MDMTIKWYLDNREWMEEIVLVEYKKYYEEMYSSRLKGHDIEAIIVAFDEIVALKHKNK